MKFFAKSILIIVSSCSLLAGASSNDNSFCDMQIQEMVCLVDPPAQEKDRYTASRTCLNRGEKYAKQFVQTYRQFPSFVRKAVCSLKRIYLEKEFLGPAWSAMADDADKNSGLVGLRLKDLASNQGLEKYDSWFEQQTFGGAIDFTIEPSLPTVVVTPIEKSNVSYLNHTLLHEMGHILDYIYHYNKEACDSQKQCISSPQSWTTISWTNMQTPKQEVDFPLRKSICLNACKGKFIPAPLADKLYTDLYDHGFISQLAASNSMEDFAETFEVYVAARFMNIHYGIRANTKSYSLDDSLASPPFQEKRRFLEAQISKLDGG